MFPEPTRNVVGGYLRPLIGVVTIGSRVGSCQLTIHDDRVGLAVVARLDVDKRLIPTLGLIGVGSGLLNIHSAVQDERVVSHRGSLELRLRESSREVRLPVGEVYRLLLASHVVHLEVPVQDNHDVTLNLISVDDVYEGPRAIQWGVRDFRNVLRRRSLLQTLRDSREAILLHLTLRDHPQGEGLLRDTVDEVWN